MLVWIVNIAMVGSRGYSIENMKFIMQTTFTVTYKYVQ